MVVLLLPKERKQFACTQHSSVIVNKLIQISVGVAERCMTRVEELNREIEMDALSIADRLDGYGQSGVWTQSTKKIEIEKYCNCSAIDVSMCHIGAFICAIFGVPMTFPSIFARGESVRLSVHFVATQPKWVMFGAAGEIRHVPFSWRRRRNHALPAIDASYRISVGTKCNPAMNREKRNRIVILGPKGHGACVHTCPMSDVFVRQRVKSHVLSS